VDSQDMLQLEKEDEDLSDDEALLFKD